MCRASGCSNSRCGQGLDAAPRSVDAATALDDATAAMVSRVPNTAGMAQGYGNAVLSDQPRLSPINPRPMSSSPVREPVPRGNRAPR